MAVNPVTVAPLIVIVPARRPVSAPPAVMAKAVVEPRDKVPVAGEKTAETTVGAIVSFASVNAELTAGVFPPASVTLVVKLWFPSPPVSNDPATAKLIVVPGSPLAIACVFGVPNDAPSYRSSTVSPTTALALSAAPIVTVPPKSLAVI
jgi:hypothetical protein